MKDKKIILIAGVLIILLIGYFFFLKNTEEKVIVIPKNSDYSIYKAPKLPELEDNVTDNSHVTPSRTSAMTDWISKAGFTPEYEKRVRKELEYFDFGNTGIYLLKDIDKELLIARQYRLSREDDTLLNTDKLSITTKEEFDSVKNLGTPLDFMLMKENEFVQEEGLCIKINLDNGQETLYCDPKPNEYGEVYMYHGYLPEKNLHLLSYFIEEGGKFFVDQGDGEDIRAPFQDQIFTPDKKYLIMSSPYYWAGYNTGGISVMEFNSNKKPIFMGGYLGDDRWAVKEVRVSSNNEFYFKTAAYVYDETQQYNRREVYSYFKQELE